MARDTYERGFLAGLEFARIMVHGSYTALELWVRALQDVARWRVPERHRGRRGRPRRTTSPDPYGLARSTNAVRRDCQPVRCPRVNEGSGLGDRITHEGRRRRSLARGVSGQGSLLPVFRLFQRSLRICQAKHKIRLFIDLSLTNNGLQFNF